MADDTPSPTPEGQLIRKVRDLSIPKLTIRAAATRSGLSAEQWGYIERGYYPAKDGNPPRPFSPPAVTLAKMAYVLDIAPERLESEAQRPDAAEVLREIRAVPTHDPVTPQKIREYLGDSDGPPTDASGPYGRREEEEYRTAADRPYADRIWQRLHALAAQGITDPSGAQLFPDSPADAKTWDGTAGRMDLGDRTWLVADLQRRAAERSSRPTPGR
jgi:hypothetical protein